MTFVLQRTFKNIDTYDPEEYREACARQYPELFARFDKKIHEKLFLSECREGYISELFIDIDTISELMEVYSLTCHKLVICPDKFVQSSVDLEIYDSVRE